MSLLIAARHRMSGPYWAHRSRRAKINGAALVRASAVLESMLVSENLLAAPYRGEAVWPATGSRQIKTSEAEQDGRRAAVQQRQEHRRISLFDRRLEHVTDKISRSHFAGQNECGKPREQSEQQKPTKHQLQTAGDHRQRRRVGEEGQSRKLEDLGHTVLKQQQPGDEPKEAQCPRLPSTECLIHFFHCLLSPL